MQIGGDMSMQSAITRPSSRLMPGSRKRQTRWHQRNVFLFCIVLLSSCSLFKKTTKTTNSASFDLSKQTEARSLALETAQKETQIYSFWKDSIFYQYAMIKEKVEQERAGTLKVQENQEATQEKAVNESQPVESWIYMGIILCIVGVLLIFKKLSI